jgi:hypothetical protein
MTALQRKYFGKRRGGRRSTALVRRGSTNISVRVGGSRRGGGRRRGRRGGVGGWMPTIKEYGYNFGAAAIYGYVRGGHTQNINEVLDKLPGKDTIGVDLRNAVAFALVNRYLIRSHWLDRLTLAAVMRSGDHFGASKFAKLEGPGRNGSDAVEGHMDE